MNKRQFYKMLAKKYDLPLEYIRFTVDPIYIWNGNKKLSIDELNDIENAIRWNYVQEDFERDGQKKKIIVHIQKKNGVIMIIWLRGLGNRDMNRKQIWKILSQ